MPAQPDDKDDSVYDDTRREHQNQRQRAHCKDKTFRPRKFHVATLEQGARPQRFDEDGDDRSKPRADEYCSEREKRGCTNIHLGAV